MAKTTITDPGPAAGAWPATSNSSTTPTPTSSAISTNAAPNSANTRPTSKPQLTEAEHHAAQATNPHLLDALPVGPLDLDRRPPDLTRALFEALRLQIHYNKITNTATCRISLSAQTIHAAADAATTALTIPPTDEKDNTDMTEERDPNLSPLGSLWCPRPASTRFPAGPTSSFGSGRLVVEATASLQPPGGGR
jgi:hypothetical protein